MSLPQVNGTRRIGARYRVAGVLGHGGMATVWLAEDELLRRPVAIKEVQFPPGLHGVELERLRERTLREARTAARLTHPNAVRIYDVVEDDGRPCIVMERLDGETLADRIRREGPLPPAEVARVGLAVLDALDTAHAAGIVHRDVKPSNVVLGGDGRVTLTDFGIAVTAGDPSLTTTGLLVGSPAYIAPERARGKSPGPASDLWSLGATLFTAVAGRPPFDAGDALGTLTAVATDDAPPAPCGGRLGNLVDGLLARDPERRPRSAAVRAELTAATREAHATESLPPPRAKPTESAARTAVLEAPAAGGGSAIVRPAQGMQMTASAPAPPVTPMAPGPDPAFGRRRRRNPVPAIAGVLALIVAVGVTVGFLSTRHSTGDPSRQAGDITRAAPAAPASPAASTTPTTAHSPSASNSGPASTPVTASKPSAATAAPVAPVAPAAASPATGVPAGWVPYTSPSGWSVAHPAGWTEKNSATGAVFTDPAGGGYLQVDTTSTPGPSALGAWQQEEKTFSATHSDYQRLEMANVGYRSYDAADWQFTWREKGAALEAVNRGMVTDPHHGYALFFVSHADQWGASAPLLAGFYSSFTPAA